MTTHDLSRRRLLAATAASMGLAALHTPAWSQSSYPDRPVRIVVGYAPGGSVDFAARVVADMLAARMNATTVVDNASGAAGTLGAQKVVSSKPDGYTLLVGSSNEMAATAQVNPAQRYDPLADLTPIALVATAPVLLAATPKLGVHTLDDFWKLVKAHPGKYSYGSSGVGSTLHFVGELVKHRGGLFMTHIPYRGTAPLTADLASGVLDFAILSPTAAEPFLQGKRIVPLGISSLQPFAGHAPIGGNAHFQGLDLSGWFAVAGPKNLPADIAQRIRRAVQEGLADPALRKRLEQGGSIPASGNEDLVRVMREDSRKYADLVKIANITP